MRTLRRKLFDWFVYSTRKGKEKRDPPRIKTFFLFSKRSFFSYEIDRLWEECNNSTIYIFDFQQLIFLSFCSILLLKLLSFQIDSLLIRIKRSIRPFVKSQTICKICPLAKQKHLPFQSHNNICDEPFDLIHIDILGPFSVETTEQKVFDIFEP